jgi:8-amino-7-oxononanoate synthase
MNGGPFSGVGSGELCRTASRRAEQPLNEMCLAALAGRDERGLLRRRQIVHSLDATHIEFEGKRYVNFASNDYLGLTHHPKMISAVRSAAQQFGVGSGAAALISGYTTEHAVAEREIAQWKHMQSAILLPSGYQANLAAVQTLGAMGEFGIRAEAGPAKRKKPGVRFLVDQLAHASLIDAVRTSGAAWRIFPHNHLGKLERLLSQGSCEQVQVVVTESIFSMDGDAADFWGLQKLKKQFDFTLLVDEAHGTGVYGIAGNGYADEMGHSDIVDVSVLTLSKALGCVGGAICGSEAFIQAVVNFGRASIFSTSIPATTAAAARAAIGVMREEPKRQKRVRESARKIRAALRVDGLIDSPIIPVILGEERAALDAAERLKDAGLWVVAVRPPTVRRGSSRLRITVSSEHTDEEIDGLIRAVKRRIQI